MSRLSVHDLWIALCCFLLLSGVSTIVGPHFAMAAALHPHWNTPKPSWHVVLTPDPGTTRNVFNGVAAISPADIWAVGSADGQTLAEHWDGSTWSALANIQINGDLASIAAITTNDVWAAGSIFGEKTILEHWDGSAWTLSSQVFDGYLFSIAAIATNDVWAVGRDDNFMTLTLHWDGSTWTRFPSPSPSSQSNFLFGVTATSADNVWAVGSDAGEDSMDHALTEHWDGTQWSLVSDQELPGRPTLGGVTALSSGQVWAVGGYMPLYDGNRPYVQSWDGSSWSPMAVPAPTKGTSSLNSAITLSANDVWAVGNASSLLFTRPPHPGLVDTLIEHWDGSSWKRIASEQVGIVVTLAGIAAIPGTSQLVAAGSYIPLNGFHEQTLVEVYA